MKKPFNNAESERWLAAIVDSSDDAIISKDLNGIITSWNKGAAEMFGYTAEEIIGKPATTLMPPDRVNEEPGILRSIRRGERIDHYETVRQRKDGSLLEISLSVSPVTNERGEVVGASKIARDITARRRTEEALSESNQLFRALVNSVPSITWSAARDGTIIWSSAQWYEYTGLTPENSNDWARLVLHPDDFERCLAQWTKALENGKEYSIEVRNRRHDGEYRWFLTRATPRRGSLRR